MPSMRVALLLSIPLFAGCGVDANDLFSSGSAGGSGASGTGAGHGASSGQGGAAASVGPGGPVGSGGSGTGGASASGSVASTTQASSTGTGMCAHDPCTQGGPLDPACDACVGAICQQIPGCCQQGWGPTCMQSVGPVCQRSCGTTPSCTDLYGQTPGYYTCTDGAECTFGFDSTTRSCATVCSGGGGECLGAYNNNGQCGLGQQVDCNFTGFFTAICVCSHGCGGGPPCMNGQTCHNGFCQ